MSLIAAGAGEATRAMAAPENGSDGMELALPVRKNADAEASSAAPAPAASDEPVLAIPVPKGQKPEQSGESKAEKLPAEEPEKAASERSEKKVSQKKTPERATPEKKAAETASEKKRTTVRKTESRPAQPRRKSEPKAVAKPAPKPEPKPEREPERESEREEKTETTAATPEPPAERPAEQPAETAGPKTEVAELPLSLEETPAPARPTRRPGMLRRALSAILPGRKSGPAPAPFNTDYRTRSRDAVIPVSISGNGLGGRDIPIGSEDALRASLPADFCPTDLVRVAPELCLTSGQPIFLRQEAARSFERMCRDAAAEGLKIQVFSGYRDYGHQSRLYAEAVKKRGPNQKTVARPGRSEHFLGTTCDVTNGQPRHLLSRSFANSPEGKWLEKNAARYGWKMTVRAGGSRGNHDDEPWHIRYLGSEALASAGEIRPAASDPTPARPSLARRLGRLVGIGR